MGSWLGWARRVRVTGAAMLVAVGVGASAQEASGAANYAWLNCSSFDRVAAEPGVSFWRDGGYLVDAACGASNPNWSWQIKSVDNASGAGTGGSVVWNAPAGTLIRSIELVIDARSADHNSADLTVHTPGAGDVVVYRAPDAPGGFRSFTRTGLGASSVEARLYCARTSSCARTDRAHLWVREVVVTLEDLTPPRIALGPSTLVDTPGWVRGNQTLSATASDPESGLFDFGLNINGSDLGQGAGIACPFDLSRPYATQQVPCNTQSAYEATFDTRRAPFVNGWNTVTFGGHDYPSGVNYLQRTVMVDNLAPSAAFANSENPDDPELIKANVSDLHSGLATYEIGYRQVASTGPYRTLAVERSGSELIGRVDSAEHPPGEYEFRVSATDRAGNVTTSTRRANGQPMILSFPLRSPVTLEAHLGGGAGEEQRVGYNSGSTAEGRLVGPNGAPLAHQSVTVVEEMENGSLYPMRDWRAVTDGEGRWTVAIPPGPSGELRAYFDGTPRYQPAQDRVGVLRVNSRASFAPVRRRVPEGEAVRFAGSVHHRDARIPIRGKQLSIQVKLGNKAKWITVKEDFRTRASGRFRFRYRFGKSYTQNVRYKFRLKIHGEADWPYLETLTRPRPVIVVAGRPEEEERK